MREELSEDARAQNVVKSTHAINASDRHVGVLFRDHPKEVGEGISARSVTEPEILRCDSLPELLLKFFAKVFPTKRRIVQPAATPRTLLPPFLRAVKRDKRMASTMSCGMSLWATCSQASARSSIAVSSSKHGVKNSHRVPPRPRDKPRRAD